MKLQIRPRSNTLRHRIVWQCASLLLSYPDQDRLNTVDELLAHLDGDAADLLGRTANALKVGDRMRVAADYVDTFDLRRRATIYLTYWTAGDTRNRGAAMLEFAAAYRKAGVEPPHGEAPDFLPVALEFADGPDWRTLPSCTNVKSNS
jgi:nitrate reductase delta subunit